MQAGKYTVQVSARGFDDDVKYVDVNELNVYPKLVLFTLSRNRDIMGLPRLVFVFLTGEFVSVCAGFLLDL